MKIHTYKTTQIVHTDLQTCWDFFSSPGNLQKITPPSMGFNIISGADRKMYPGQIITYTVKPFLGIPVTWVTEITQVKEWEFFIDEQRFGPYKFWHHQHFFRLVPEGIEMTDIVHYVLPFGVLGMIAIPMVKKKLREIFSYREKVIGQGF
jgi:ligand-binding SRPBCC domain-containing protein